jgi:hypothetical protein
MNNFPPLNKGVTFDDLEAASDFTNQLMPPPAAMTITQPPVDEATQAGGGAGDIPPPPGGPIPPQVGGGAGVPGSGQGAPGGGTYSGLEAALAQLGHTMYDAEAIRAELGVQRGVNPGDAASRAAFPRLRRECATSTHVSGYARGTDSCNHDPYPRSLLLHLSLNVRISRKGVGIDWGSPSHQRTHPHMPSHDKIMGVAHGVCGYGFCQAGGVL